MSEESAASEPLEIGMDLIRTALLVAATADRLVNAHLKAEPTIGILRELINDLHWLEMSTGEDVYKTATDLAFAIDDTHWCRGEWKDGTLYLWESDDPLSQ